MAVNPLNLLATLRPWRSAGVCHLLAFEDAAERLEEGLAAVPAPVAESSPATDEADFATCSEISRKSAKLPTKTSSAPPVGQTLQHQPAQRRPQTAMHTAKPAARETAPPQSPVPGEWPEPWRQLFHKVRPAPLLWSYAGLDADLLARGEDSKERSTLLRALISDLQLPKGSSTFWPLCATLSPLPEAGQPDASPFFCSSFFFAGLSLLNPTLVVIFGATGNAPMPDPAPYTQGIVSGRVFVYLPALNDLSAIPAQRHRATAFLRSIVSQFSPL